jgi:hypothetical protein
MSHNQRLMWLKTIGWLPDDRGADLSELGRCVIVRGSRLGQDEAFWLAANDGRAAILEENTPVKSWEELQAWVTEKPEAKKPLAAQRNLFDLDSD